jgi:hypothetical protein
MSVANAESVEVEVDGKIYQASYFVWKGVVTVEYEGGEKSTQVGGLTADQVARHLLSEMIGEKKTPH